MATITKQTDARVNDGMSISTVLVRLAPLLCLGMLTPGPAAAQCLKDIDYISDSISRTHCEYDNVNIPKGKQRILAELDGPGKITYFYITDNTIGHFDPGLVLQIFWDQEAEPSVNVPLADFFGAVGGRTVDYQSVPMQIHDACYMCYLPMPFSRHARIVLVNDGDKDYSQSVACGIDWEKGAEFARNMSRLHCCWSRSNPTKDSLHTLLEVRGRGHYIGNFLQVYSRYHGWWGEGDTIFRVDGKTMTHTPGTEDEYGSCWGEHNWKTYAHLYCGHIVNEKGVNRMYRWYLANPVRFRESLKIEIQDQRAENGQIPSRDDFTSVAFWYQVEPHQHFALQPFAERTAPSRAAEYKQSSK